jgi:hypothetical protein
LLKTQIPDVPGVGAVSDHRRSLRLRWVHPKSGHVVHPTSCDRQFLTLVSFG